MHQYYKMVITQVDLIEIIGGGSCRCMLVENWSTITSQMIDHSLNQSNLSAKKPSKHIQSNKYLNLQQYNQSFFEDIIIGNTSEKTNENSVSDIDNEESFTFDSDIVKNEFYMIKRISQENFFFQYDEQNLSQLGVYEMFNIDYLNTENELPNYWDKQFSNPFEDLLDILDSNIAFTQDQVKIKLHKKFTRSN